jgi:hypothetical protein
MLAKSNLSAERGVALRDLVDERRVWVKQHDVKVLNGLNRLQGTPVLKPEVLFNTQNEQEKTS